jgi:hypothetical protein
VASQACAIVCHLTAGEDFEHDAGAAATWIIVLMGCGTSLAASTGWLTYVNPRFGVAVDYPVAFSRRDPPPANGDGQTFRTPGGDAVLVVFGSYNINGETPAQLMKVSGRSRRNLHLHKGNAAVVRTIGLEKRPDFLCAL